MRMRWKIWILKLVIKVTGTRLKSVLRGVIIVDAVPVVRCKDCKHRPIIPEGFDKSCGGIDLEFPDDECPCKCVDGWYSWYPPDDFFCARGKQKGEDK